MYGQYGRSVIALQEVPREEIRFYGAATPEPVEENLVKVLDIVEKPDPADGARRTSRRSDATSSRPRSSTSCDKVQPGVGGEIQLTDAINSLAKLQVVYGYLFDGVRYDIGKKIDYLRATVELAAEREDLGEEFREFLAEFVTRKKLV